MIFHKSITFLIEISSMFIIICLIASQRVVLSMSVINETDVNKSFHPQVTYSSNSRAIDSSRQFGREAQFVNSNWKIWDQPEDQLAIESKHIQPNKPYRKSKNFNNGTGKRGYDANSVNFENNAGGTTGTQRQGCNNGVQVSLFPVVVALIAAIAGLITIAIVWFIAKKWTVEGSSTGYSSSGTSNYGTGNGGWNSQQRKYDLTGFSRMLKNIDFEQLTSMVTNGIESYKKIFEQPTST